jgi:hypothetical protein
LCIGRERWYCSDAGVGGAARSDGESDGESGAESAGLPGAGNARVFVSVDVAVVSGSVMRCGNARVSVSVDDVAVVSGWVMRGCDLREASSGSLQSFSSIVVPVLPVIIVKNASGSESTGSGGTIVSTSPSQYVPRRGGGGGDVRGCLESGSSQRGRITFTGKRLRDLKLPLDPSSLFSTRGKLFSDSSFFRLLGPGEKRDAEPVFRWRRSFSGVGHGCCQERDYRLPMKGGLLELTWQDEEIFSSASGVSAVPRALDF